MNISAAAREGVTRAVAEGLAANDRRAYEATPETVDPFWDEAQAG